MILILNEIYILTKTLWYATKFGEYLSYLKHSFLLLNIVFDPDPEKKKLKKVCGTNLDLMSFINI